LNKAIQLLLVGILYLLVGVGCQNQPAAKKVRLNYTEQLATGTASNSEPRPLHVAVAAIISPKSTYSTYRSLLDYLGKEMNRPAKLVQRSTYAAINELVRVGQVDMAFVCTRAYVEGHDSFGMELLAVPQIHGQTVYHSYIIVSSQTDFYTLSDLRGHSFAFTDPLSNTGHLVPIYLLNQMGENPETFFDRTTFTYSHDNSIHSVAEGVVDAAAVDSLVYDQLVAQDPSIAEKTRIIYRSPPYGAPPVVVPPDIDPGLKQELQQKLLHLHETPEGRQILQRIGVDRFVLPHDSAYDTVRAMMAEVSGDATPYDAQR